MVVASHYLEVYCFIGLKTFRTDASVSGEAIFNCVKALLDDDELTSSLKTMLCLMSDTSAVNTDIHRGAATRLAQHCNMTYGHDVLTLECLYHCIELLLGDVVMAFDGDTKSPDTMCSSRT